MEEPRSPRDSDSDRPQPVPADASKPAGAADPAHFADTEIGDLPDLPPEEGAPTGPVSAAESDDDGVFEFEPPDEGLDPDLQDRLNKRPRRRLGHIGLFGPMGVGKTTYLASLYLALDRAGYLNHDLTDADTNAFLDWFVRHLRKGESLPATQTSWELALGVTKEGRNRRLAFRDIPGGWFTEESSWDEALRDIEGQLRECRGSMFFVDTSLLIDRDPDDSERRFVSRVIDRAIRRTQQSWGGFLTGVRPPVVICFSKIDRLTPEHAPDRLTALDQPTLLQQKADYLWEQLGRFDTVFREGKYNHAAYFGLSALGDGWDETEKRQRKIAPQGVMEPFWFLVEATRRVQKARRSRLLTLTATLLVALLTTLGVLGYGVYSQEALPDYESLVADLDAANTAEDENRVAAQAESLETLVDRAEAYRDRWSARDWQTLWLIHDELATLDGRIASLRETLADRQFTLLQRATDEPAATIDTAARYDELIGRLEAYRDRFPNANTQQIDAWLRTFGAKRDFATTWDQLTASTALAPAERQKLEDRITVLRQRHPEIAPAIEEARSAWRTELDGRLIQQLRAELNETQGTIARLAVLQRFLAETDPGPSAREVAEQQREVLVQQAADELDRRLRQVASDQPPRDWLVASLETLETWRSEVSRVDGLGLVEVGSAAREAIQAEYADRRAQAVLALAESAGPEDLEQVEAALRDYLREFQGNVRRLDEIEAALEALGAAQIQTRLERLQREAQAVTNESELRRFLAALATFAEANPTRITTERADELRAIARRSWPRSVLQPKLEQSRTPAVFDNPEVARSFAAELDQAIEPFRDQPDPVVSELVATAIERAAALRFRSMDLDYRTFRDRYTTLFTEDWNIWPGRTRLSEVTAEARTFLETHGVGISDEGRATVEQALALMEWANERRTVTVTIGMADFSDGTDNDHRITLTRIDGRLEYLQVNSDKEEGDRPTYNITAEFEWRAFDRFEIKGYTYGFWGRSKQFFYRNIPGFLSILSLTTGRQANQFRGDKGDASNWIQLALTPIEGMPTVIRPDDMPETLPQ